LLKLRARQLSLPSCLPGDRPVGRVKSNLIPARDRNTGRDKCQTDHLTGLKVESKKKVCKADGRQKLKTRGFFRLMADLHEVTDCHAEATDYLS
jgi:hypothetical protein